MGQIYTEDFNLAKRYTINIYRLGVGVEMHTFIVYHFSDSNDFKIGTKAESENKSLAKCKYFVMKV